MRDCLKCEHLTHCNEIGRIYYGTAAHLQDRFQDSKYAVVAPGRFCPIKDVNGSVPEYQFNQMDTIERAMSYIGLDAFKQTEDISKLADEIAVEMGWKNGI